MGREKRSQPGPATAKDRHKRAGKPSKTLDRSVPLPPGLVAAKPVNAVTNSKHQSYFEFIENKDKKKPLLFEITANHQVEEIPRSQTEINRQADAALRELFPRIPHTDRQQIIDHAFRKGKQFKGELVVGLQQELSLSRRVQLAVLAHIRHNHTRYDELLRETSWHNARRATEQLCLDILVKWRGDDENGRNQLDEILREVVVLSDDSDDEDSGEEPDSDSSAVLTDRSMNVARVPVPTMRQDRASRSRMSTALPSHPGSPQAVATPGKKRVNKKHRRRAAKHKERNFSRYEAVANARWSAAMNRQKAVSNAQPQEPGVVNGSILEMTSPTSGEDHHPEAPPYEKQTGCPLAGGVWATQKVLGRSMTVVNSRELPFRLGPHLTSSSHRMLLDCQLTKLRARSNLHCGETRLCWEREPIPL
ncbi:hypothetical protein K4K56_008530 [Colletotrichum sp. SAR 10_98]|nr:hypothetical protein K4K56_008530 [Colletotrichum sp. SAR 10_98]